MKSQRLFFNKQYSVDNNIFSSTAGIVGIISDNAHIKLLSNNIITTDIIKDINVIYLNKSVSIQKNNNFIYLDKETALSSEVSNQTYFYLKNNKSYVSIRNEINLSGEYIDILENTICNFTDISYKCDYTDIINGNNLQNSLIQDFYIRSHAWMHDAKDISIISPSLITDGLTVKFVGNLAQEVLANFDIIINDYSNKLIEKIQTFLNNFPKNLNGYVLNIIFENSNINTILDTKLTIENFDAGTVKLFGKNKNCALINLNILLINNCAAVEIENIVFSHTHININNCKNIIFNNIEYILNINTKFNILLSNILVKNSIFKLTTDDYFGCVSTNSKVYIHLSCTTYKFINNTYKQIINENIKKFNVVHNSQVTWFTYLDLLARLINNVLELFTDNIYSLITDNSSNGLKNHIHASFALNGVLQNFLLFNSIISAMPVGSTFYWPRAFRFSDYITNTDKLKQFNWENLRNYGLDEYKKYMYTYSPKLPEYNDIYTSGQIITTKNGEQFRVTPLIPFVLGAIPFALHYPSGTLDYPYSSNNIDPQNGWLTEFTRLKENLYENEYIDDYINALATEFYNFNLSGNTTAVTNAYFPSHKYKNYFYKSSLYESYWTPTVRLNQSIESVADNFLSLAYIIQHPCGPSERTNRCDQFGALSFDNNCPIRTTTTNASNITLLLGSTHNTGGQNPTYYHTTTQYTHQAPPHSEYWYSRQGIHVVFQVAGLINTGDKCLFKLPAYLQNGYLKFSYKFTPPTNNKKEWFGTFMVCDDYRILKNSQIFLLETICKKYWPAYRYETMISFKLPGTTYMLNHPVPAIRDKKLLINPITNTSETVNLSAGSLTDPYCRNAQYYNTLDRWLSKFPNTWNDEYLVNRHKYMYSDSNDIPIYGNYFLAGQNDIYLPINKITGKYLVFGLRGTYSTNLMLLDANGRLGIYW